MGDTESLRRRLFRHLHPPAWPTPGLSPLNKILLLLIVVGALLGVLQTERNIVVGNELFFETSELVLGVIFLAEYFARIWTIAEVAPDAPHQTRLRFARTPAALFDLLAVLVTLLPFLGLNGAVLRLVRLLRILRIGRLGRFSEAFARLMTAIAARRYEFAVTLTLAAVVLILGATALHWLEGGIQPEKFGSVPRSLWWAVITLTTIGYGDVYPVTLGGKLVAGMVALAGVGLIALPAGLLASAFGDAISRRAE